jgi:uncharacterized protein (DUF3084 family)
LYEELESKVHELEALQTELNTRATSFDQLYEQEREVRGKLQAANSELEVSYWSGFGMISEF